MELKYVVRVIIRDTSKGESLITLVEILIQPNNGHLTNIQVFAKDPKANSDFEAIITYNVSERRIQSN